MERKTEPFEYYRKAMRISESVMRYAKTLVKEGARALDIVDEIEKKIVEEGGKPAFPVNLSINEIAAHYTPDRDDPLTLKQGDVVKVDVGIHVNGYISDRAFTVCVGERGHELIKAAEEALKEALKLIRPGNRVFEVSKVVEEVITSFGFNPVRNLSGHGLGRYIQHAEPTIPNGENNIQTEFKEGQVIAMEVFATDGLGWVKDSYPVLIYSLQAERPVRSWEARKILTHITKEYKTLPFARRWLAELVPKNLDVALAELIRVKALREYPILKEKSNGLVAQAEETIILE